jgi:hypothetical protein
VEQLPLGVVAREGAEVHRFRRSGEDAWTRCGSSCAPCAASFSSCAAGATAATGTAACIVAVMPASRASALPAAATSTVMKGEPITVTAIGPIAAVAPSA